MSETIEVDISELGDKIQQLIWNNQVAVPYNVEQVARELVNDMARNCPVKTGATRDSFRLEGFHGNYQIYANVVALFIEKGHHNVPARPFMRESFERFYDKFVWVIKQAMHYNLK